MQHRTSYLVGSKFVKLFNVSGINLLTKLIEYFKCFLPKKTRWLSNDLKLRFSFTCYFPGEPCQAQWARWSRWSAWRSRWARPCRRRGRMLWLPACRTTRRGRSRSTPTRRRAASKERLHRRCGQRVRRAFRSVCEGRVGTSEIVAKMNFLANKSCALNNCAFKWDRK